MNSVKTIFLFLILPPLFFGCEAEPEQPKKRSSSSHSLQSNAIEIYEPWARPASKGGNSAVYLDIHNGTNHADTLQAIASNVAGKAEIHQSFEENGMAGMRPADQQIIFADGNLKFNPGGLHIMLIGLNRSLAEGDSVSLDLEFAVEGNREIKVPVRLSNSGM